MNLLKWFIAIIAVVAVVVLYNRYNSQQNKPDPVVETSPTPSIEQDLEQVLGRSIADDADKVELVEGENKAIVTKEVEEDATKISVLADLPEGEYTAYLSNGETAEPIGQLSEVKGGYILDTTISLDITEYSTVQITSANGIVLQGILE